MKRARNCFYVGHYLLTCQRTEKEAEEDARDILEEQLDILR